MGKKDSAKKDKNEQFIEKLNAIYKDRAEEILQYHYQAPLKTFRVNTLVSNAKDVIDELQKQNFEIQKTKIENAYICTNSTVDHKLSSSSASLEHKIYIQELSSMIPAMIMLKDNPVLPQATILDLCASPGSKTTQLAALTNNKAEIVSIEKNKNRFFKMRELVLMHGCTNVKTIMIDANRLAYNYPQYTEYFDYVLVDAPCTNEASINLSNSESLKYWSEKNSKGISKLQKGLLNSAFKLVKKGGVVVYSTCTYSVEENEAVVDWIWRKWKGEPKAPLRGKLKVEEIKSEITELLGDNKNFMPGISSYKDKTFSKEVEKCVRIIPDGKFKGFFIAKFTKQ